MQQCRRQSHYDSAAPGIIRVVHYVTDADGIAVGVLGRLVAGEIVLLTKDDPKFTRLLKIITVIAGGRPKDDTTPIDSDDDTADALTSDISDRITDGNQLTTAIEALFGGEHRVNRRGI